MFRSDVLVFAGLDDRRSGGHVLQRAQELMADAVHAEQAFSSTCGSSLSVKSAMLSVAGPGEKLLVGRDAHKSVVSGLILSGVHPIWVEPEWDAERHLAHPPSADLAAIARECHRRGRPLIVNEAWGAHLPFHPDLPAWAMDAGADVCVTSVHKMGAGLEQGSVFHQQAG